MGDVQLDCAPVPHVLRDRAQEDAPAHLVDEREVADVRRVEPLRSDIELLVGMRQSEREVLPQRYIGPRREVQSFSFSHVGVIDVIAVGAAHAEREIAQRPHMDRAREACQVEHRAAVCLLAAPHFQRHVRLHRAGIASPEIDSPLEHLP